MADPQVPKHGVLETIDAGIRDVANLVVEGVTLGRHNADELAGYMDQHVGTLNPEARAATGVEGKIAAEEATTQKLDAEIPVAQRAAGAAVGVAGVVAAVGATAIA